MNGVLADTSVWIAYLKGRPEDKRVADALDYLLSIMTPKTFIENQTLEAEL